MAPKNNLDFVMARQASLDTIPRSASPPKPIPKTFKFKPSITIPPPRVSQPRKANSFTTDTPTTYRGMPFASQAASSSRITSEPVVIDIDDSFESTSGSIGVVQQSFKRSSPDDNRRTKRLKNDAPSSPSKGKENKRTRTPPSPSMSTTTIQSSQSTIKGKEREEPSRLFMISDDEDAAAAVMDVDLDNPFTSIRLDFPEYHQTNKQPTLQENKTPVSEPPIPPIPRNQSTPRILTDIPSNNQIQHPDLRTKSVVQLKRLRDWNKQTYASVTEAIADHHENGGQGEDIVILRKYRDMLKDRITAIDSAISHPGSSVLGSSRPSPVVAASPAITRSSTPVPRIHTTSFPSEVSSRALMEVETQHTVLETSRYFDTTTTLVNTENEIIEIPDNNSEDEYWQDDDLPEFVENAMEIILAESAPMPRPVVPDEKLINTPYYEEIMDVLKTKFKLTSFRTNQLEAITATLSGRDVFVLMPTGGGKSLCYQLPAICRTGKTRGVTFVVSPLLALMHDQVVALQKKGVDVVLWNSERTSEENKAIVARLNSSRKPSAVYVTPEKLKESGLLQSKLLDLYRAGELARFVIDEAHCISSWGQDFRDAYQDLGLLRERYPKVPIMALTATAKVSVVADIKTILQLKDCVSLSQSFNRPNLRYIVIPKPRNLLDSMAEWIKKHHNHACGVIYCLSRADCENVAKSLRDTYRLQARHFHAGMMPEDKSATMKDWMDGRFKIVVATIAFGMGIDKPDVRFVIHHSLPKSLDGYYQETGRAGRDGKPSDCLLYYHYGDSRKLISMIRREQNGTKPSAESIQRQEDTINDVVKFCLNETECRRVYILRYFGEKFETKNCRKGCDVCENPKAVERMNVSRYARSVVLAVKTLAIGGNVNISDKMFTNILLGSKTRDLVNKGLDQNSYHGLFKGDSNARDILDGVFTALTMNGVLESYPVKNAAGFTSHYLRAGRNADDFLRKGSKLELTKSKPTAK